MQALTKNHQSEDKIRQMTHRAFGEGSYAAHKELTEGFFNTAYLVTLQDGREAVLKVAPAPGVRVMRYEKDIMQAEIEAMRLVEKVEGIPAPKVLFADESGELCASAYFFMEKLEGASLNSLRESGAVTQEEVIAAHEESGRICARLNAMHGLRFGYPGQPELQQTEWLPMFRIMLEMAFEDAKDGNVEEPITREELFALLERDKAAFAQVRTPCLVHWDLWDGNLFVKDGKVVGVIDWERCLWADPLMEVGFRTYDDDKSFLRGYAIGELTQEQATRALWYDIYLLLLMSLETEYRKYEGDGFHNWCTGLLRQQLDKVRTR